ncbi:MAG: hypothetical protein ACMG57_05925 [Candidatus Dojkabacteria bacterium]
MVMMMEQTTRTMKDLPLGSVEDFLHENYENHDARVIPIIYEIVDQYIRRKGNWNSQIPSSSTLIDVLRVSKLEEVTEDGVVQVPLDIKKFAELLGKHYSPNRIDEFERAIGSMIYRNLDWGEYPY